MRLIDADALMKRMDDSARNGGLNLADYCKISRWVAKAPIIDAVEVVRCKECVLWSPVGKHTGKCPFLIGEHQCTGDDHYCSCGERKEENAAD